MPLPSLPFHSFDQAALISNSLTSPEGRGSWSWFSTTTVSWPPEAWFQAGISERRDGTDEFRWKSYLLKAFHNSYPRLEEGESPACDARHSSEFTENVLTLFRSGELLCRFRYSLLLNQTSTGVRSERFLAAEKIPLAKIEAPTGAFSIFPAVPRRLPFTSVVVAINDVEKSVIPEPKMA